MLHQMLLASYTQPEAAGFILHGIKLIFSAVGHVIAAAICAGIAADQGSQSIRVGPSRAAVQHPDADRDDLRPVQEVAGD